MLFFFPINFSAAPESTGILTSLSQDPTTHIMLILPELALLCYRMSNVVSFILDWRLTKRASFYSSQSKNSLETTQVPPNPSCTSVSLPGSFVLSTTNSCQLLAVCVTSARLILLTVSGFNKTACNTIWISW